MTDTIRTALEAARKQIAIDRAGFIDANSIGGSLGEWETSVADDYNALLAQIDAALAEQQAEPAAFRYKDSRGHYRYVGAPLTAGWTIPPNIHHDPLYTHPPAGTTTAEYLSDGLVRLIGEYGGACRNSRNESEITHRWQQLVGGIKGAVSEARARALEDAAKVCESTDLCGDPFDGWLEIIGKRIRALQDQAPQPAKPTEAQVEARDALLDFISENGTASEGVQYYLDRYVRAAFAAKESK